MVRTGTGANPVYERTIYIDGIFEYHILENGTTYEKNYVHIMDDRSRIAMVRIGDQFPDDINEAITYNLENQIGSSTIRLTETGTIIDKEEYYPFGDSSLRTFSKKRYRYVGREKDLESGLYYYGARYYCAWTCRFISVDPLAAKYAQLSPYNYADNNPVNDYDIDGMQDNDTSNSAGTGGGAEPAQNRGEGVQQSGAGENIDTNTINTGDLEELRNSFEAPTVSENPTGGTIKQDLPNIENIEGEPPTLPFPLSHSSRFTPLEKPALEKEHWERYSPIGEFSGFEQCAAAAARACYNANPKALPLEGWEINQIYISGDPALKKYKQPTDSSKKLALELVHLSLEQGLPVMTGIDHTQGDGFAGDGFTDHYVVIYDRGIDELGYPYFKYAENNAGTAEEGMSDELRFYLYPDGTLHEAPPYQVDDSGYKGRTVTGIRFNTFIKNQYNNKK